MCVCTCVHMCLCVRERESGGFRSCPVSSVVTGDPRSCDLLSASVCLFWRRDRPCGCLQVSQDVCTAVFMCACRRVYLSTSCARFCLLERLCSFKCVYLCITRTCTHKPLARARCPPRFRCKSLVSILQVYVGL